MLFSSSIFIYIVLPSFLIMHVLVEFIQEKVKVLKKIRILDILVLLFSIFFYMWACFDNVFFLLEIILVTFLLGKAIEKCRNSDIFDVLNKLKTKIFETKISYIITLIGVIFFIWILFRYKYYVGISVKNICFIPIVTPLGLSFITFSIISYIVDVYRGREAGGILDVSLYICYFPKIISGPIITWDNWLDYGCQKNLKEAETRIAVFIERFIVGLSKKIIIADNLGGGDK